ncbi:unnamed protein product [Cyprideis torosa]|uniref:RB1-inducible coiled-coil protein 1 n=1 Tax=Cyprideis torosa TaxID=163714 RepID=A0A7R8W1S6_9CRUS|nr:unnamed protein product [Cyprideis torosa]CAG0881063.1 unnamed protein product [Cyprideis torosa]
MFVFRVDTGTMLQFDMNIALDSVAKMKRVIHKDYHISPEDQVLLISGGESLDDDQRVCSYSAGTDTNPIFLFCKNAIQNHHPPIPPDPISDREAFGVDAAERCLKLRPSLETITQRAQTAELLDHEAVKLTQTCEQLINDQRLQHQAWAAVVVNLEDAVVAFSKRMERFTESYEHYLDCRPKYQQLLDDLPDDILLLGRLPLLPCLCTEASVGSVLDRFPEPTLLNWVESMKGGESLDAMADDCRKRLKQFDTKLLKTLQEKYDAVCTNVNEKNMKEIKGIENRLRGLDNFIEDGNRLREEQSRLAEIINRHKNTAANLGDTQGLPKLCETHEHHMKEMLQTQERLFDIRKKCQKSKEELCKNLHVRLKWIMMCQNKIVERDSEILFFHDNLQALRKHFGVLRQIHLAPGLYLSAAVEWSIKLSHRGNSLYRSEVARRQSLSIELEAHFLRALFSGLGDLPPNFATVAPRPFDLYLPEIRPVDVDKLKSSLPFFGDALKPFPSSAPHLEAMNALIALLPGVEDSRSLGIESSDSFWECALENLWDSSDFQLIFPELRALHELERSSASNSAAGGRVFMDAMTGPSRNLSVQQCSQETQTDLFPTASIGVGGQIFPESSSTRSPEDLEAEVMELRAMLTSKENILTSVRDELTAEVISLRGQLETEQERKNSDQVKVDTVLEERDSARRTVAELKSVIREDEAKMERLEQAKEEAEKKFALETELELETLRTEFEKEKAQLKEFLSTVEAEKASLEKHVSMLEANVQQEVDKAVKVLEVSFAEREKKAVEKALIDRNLLAEREREEYIANAIDETRAKLVLQFREMSEKGKHALEEKHQAELRTLKSELEEELQKKEQEMKKRFEEEMNSVVAHHKDELEGLRSRFRMMNLTSHHTESPTPPAPSDSTQDGGRNLETLVPVLQEELEKCSAADEKGLQALLPLRNSLNRLLSETVTRSVSVGEVMDLSASVSSPEPIMSASVCPAVPSAFSTESLRRNFAQVCAEKDKLQEKLGNSEATYYHNRVEIYNFAY